MNSVDENDQMILNEIVEYYESKSIRAMFKEYLRRLMV